MSSNNSYNKKKGQPMYESIKIAGIFPNDHNNFYLNPINEFQKHGCETTIKTLKSIDSFKKCLITKQHIIKPLKETKHKNLSAMITLHSFAVHTISHLSAQLK